MGNNRLVPTLERMVTGSRRDGFTLIELTMALALSTMVMLTAVAAFRIIARAIARANELSTENALLRAGYQAGMEDLDFWHSACNDQPPYNKGFARLRSTVDDPATNSSWSWRNWAREDMIRRPFQPVHFMANTNADINTDDPATGVWRAMASTSNSPRSYHQNPDRWTDEFYRERWVVNPNVFLAHDPRSIERGHLMLGQMPIRRTNVYSIGGYHLGTPALVLGDYRLVSASDMRDQAGSFETLFSTGDPIPVDLDRNGVQDPAGPVTIAGLSDLEVGVNLARPLQMRSLFNRIGGFGMYQYAAPGTFLVQGDECGLFYSQNSSPMQRFVNFNASPDGSLGWERHHWYEKGWGHGDLADYAGTGYHQDRTKAMMLAAALPSTVENDLNYDGILYGEGTWATMVPGKQSAWYANYTNSGRTTYTYGNWLFENADILRNDQFVTSTTVRIPYNISDVDRAGSSKMPWRITGDRAPFDYTSKPDNLPILKTNIVRYFNMGGKGTLTALVSTVESPSGNKIELLFTASGTTYRGARQHWRLYSPGIANDDRTVPPAPENAIGDFYGSNVGAGPYYVP